MSPLPQDSFNRYKKYTTDLRRYYRMPAVQTSLSVVLSLFVISFFILVAIRPTIVTITKLKLTIKESQDTLDKLNKKVATLNQITKVWDEISPLQQYMNNTIPTDGPRYQSLTKSIELLAKENNTKLSSLTVGDALTYSKVLNPYTGLKRSVVETPFSFRVTGNYPEISTFLTKLTQMDRLVTIDSVSISKDAKVGKEQATISINLNGKVTYLADQAILNTILGTKEDKNNGQ